MSSSNNWNPQNTKAIEILNSPDKVIYISKRGTRVGATHSIIKNALLMGKKITVFEPYHKIIEHTIKTILDELYDETGIQYTLGHLKSIDKMCLYPKKIGNIYLKGNCNKCQHPDRCPLKEFLNTDYDIIAMSYAKVVLSHQYESEDNLRINYKIINSDIIFMDEYSHAIHLAPYETDIEQLEQILSKLEYDKENESLFTLLVDFIAEMKELDEKDEWNDNLYYHSKLEDNFKNLIKYLTKISKLHIPIQDKKCLESLIYSMQYNHFFIMDSKIIPDVTHPINTFNDMVKSYKGKIIITDALLPSTRMLKGITIDWPDFKNIQDKQLIICDTRKAPLAYYVTNFKKYGKTYHEQIDRLRKFMYFQLGTHGINNIQTFCVNKQIANDIINFKSDDIDFTNINIHEYERASWYRSDLGAGIDFPQRIMIGINLPFTKLESYKGYAKVYTYLKEYQYLFDKVKKYNKKGLPQKVKEVILHKQIRLDEMLNTFFNTIGRVKDKNGIENSVILMFGSTEDEVRECLPINYDWNIVSTTGGDFALESHIMTNIWRLYGKREDVKALPYITKLVLFMMRNPNRTYKYGYVSQKINVNGLKKLIQKYNHLVPDITLHDKEFEVTDDYFNELVQSKITCNQVKKAIKNTIKRQKKGLKYKTTTGDMFF